jgi:hypothetical protein
MPIAVWSAPEAWSMRRPIGFVDELEPLLYLGEARRVERITFIFVLSPVGPGWVVRDVVEMLVQTYGEV